MPSTFLSGQCRNNTPKYKNGRLSEAKHAGYMWGHLPVTNLSLFLWQINSHALPQKAIVKPRYPKAGRCLYLYIMGTYINCNFIIILYFFESDIHKYVVHIHVIQQYNKIKKFW